MSYEELRDLLLARPFRPFMVVLADGRKLYARRPFAMAISPWTHECTGVGARSIMHDFMLDQIVEARMVRSKTQRAKNKKASVRRRRTRERRKA